MSSAVATAAGDNDAPRPIRVHTPSGVVQAAALPAALGDVVLGVTGKCRLWNSERTEVARELCAHFRDGLDAGVAPDELARSFGDPRQAAKLITATRKRLRPLWWRSLRTTLRGTAALVLTLTLVYAVLAARFFLVQPTVSRNITAELNAEMRSTPEADRAWPLYLEAKKAFGPLPEFMMIGAGEPSGPGDANWDEMAAWLDAHGAALETLRTAARKPIIGYRYRSTMDPDLARAMEITNPGYEYDPALEEEPENPLVVGLLLPHLGEMRRSARWLRADAVLAVSRGDRERLLVDVEAILGIGEQALRDRFTISQLVGMAVGDIAVGLVLEQSVRPGALTDDDLRNLAHWLATFGGGGRVPIDTSLDVLTVEDVLQRFFSDDGKGDGHYIGGGEEGERLQIDLGLPERDRGLLTSRAFGPVRSVMLASRAQVMEKVNAFKAAVAADDALPPWRHDERTSDQVYLDVLRSGVFAAAPSLEVLYETGNGGPLSSAFGARDIFCTKRDAALAMISAESYRRAHGAWPASLSELVPGYLPSVPLDPFDGKPLRYVAPRAEGGLPLLYSVGVDAVDEGGKLTTTEAGRFGVHHLHWLAIFRGRTPMTPEEKKHVDDVRGDWVLWPVPLPRATDAK